MDDPIAWECVTKGKIMADKDKSQLDELAEELYRTFPIVNALGELSWENVDLKYRVKYYQAGLTMIRLIVKHLTERTSRAQNQPVRDGETAQGN
jgi:hypothetical protein